MTGKVVNSWSVFGLSTRVDIVRRRRRLGLLDYSNPHLTSDYMDLRWLANLYPLHFGYSFISLEKSNRGPAGTSRHKIYCGLSQYLLMLWTKFGCDRAPWSKRCLKLVMYANGRRFDSYKPPYPWGHLQYYSVNLVIC